MTTTEPQAPMSPKEAKAHAKAATAYAKAQQNWFMRHKVLTAILALIVIAIIASASGGGGGNGVNPSNGAGNSADVGTEDNPAGRGTAVENSSAKYEITRVKVADEIPGFLGAKASGKFVIVSITVTNVKQESIQFGTGDFTLIVNGNSIDVDDNTFALDDGFSYDDLSPGLTKKGRIVFDVAPADAGTGVLKAQAQLSLDDAVYLSLK